MNAGNSPAHFVVIDGVRKALERFEDRWYWVSPDFDPEQCVISAPECPECGELLSPCCDDDTAEASIHSAWHDEHHVHCDGCGAMFPIDDAPALPSKDAGRMPCPNSENGYHPFRHHICPLCGCEQPELNEREKGDDDGVEYADPREARS